jgi:hypothetical protein
MFLQITSRFAMKTRAMRNINRGVDTPKTAAFQDRQLLNQKKRKKACQQHFVR